MITDWQTVPTSQLMELLRTCGLDVPPGLPAEIVRRKDETLAPLCALLTDEALWALREGQKEGWAPIHALHLLGAIGDARAAPALLAVLKQDLGDLLTESVPEILGLLGPAALDLLKAAVEREEYDTYERLAIARGLYFIAVQHPAERAGVAPLLTRLLRESDDEDLVSLLVGLVASIDDPATQAAVDEAFAQGRVAPMIIREADVAGIRRRAPWQFTSYLGDPMDYFSAASLDHLRRVNDPSRRAAMPPRTLSPEPPRPARDFAAPPRQMPVVNRGSKIGRNAPCPCGSGKKYKKCCGT